MLKRRENKEIVVSLHHKTLNVENYGSNDDDRSEEADFENSKVGTGPQMVH
jgi:hypothetical protein